jgi:hypothetical protein
MLPGYIWAQFFKVILWRTRFKVIYLVHRMGSVKKIQTENSPLNNILLNVSLNLNIVTDTFVSGWWLNFLWLCVRGLNYSRQVRDMIEMYYFCEFCTICMFFSCLTLYVNIQQRSGIVIIEHFPLVSKAFIAANLDACVTLLAFLWNIL